VRAPGGGVRRFAFAAETARWPLERIAAAGRALCELATGAAPLSGGVYRCPTFSQASHEIGSGWNLEREPTPFRVRMQHEHLRDVATRVRRLYPITLVGPRLRASLGASDAVAAGAAAAREVAGSLLIDAYPAVVETWDPAFLRATEGLRRWLWPLTLQNPADAAGL
jgi:hypothetical protein